MNEDLEAPEYLPGNHFLIVNLMWEYISSVTYRQSIFKVSEHNTRREPWGERQGPEGGQMRPVTDDASSTPAILGYLWQRAFVIGRPVWHERGACLLWFVPLNVKDARVYDFFFMQRADTHGI